MKKPIIWTGENLYGTWIVTRKLDGVRALINSERVVSRSGKPLYHLNSYRSFTSRDVEVFLGSFQETISKIRSVTGVEIPSDCLYDLDPLDERLYLGTLLNPSSEEINLLLLERRKVGDEGLVLRQDDIWIKVKPFETYDVPVIDIKLGKGKNFNKVGALVTPLGSVGTGLTDLNRVEFLTLPIGSVIEVICMELTPDGKFRLPRFKRLRPDK